MRRSSGPSRDSSDCVRRCLASASVFAPANAADSNGGDSRPMATASAPLWYATGKKGVPAGTLAAAAKRKLPIPPAVARAIATMASPAAVTPPGEARSEEHTSELQSRLHLVCRLLLEKKKYIEKMLYTTLHSEIAYSA